MIFLTCFLNLNAFPYLGEFQIFLSFLSWAKVSLSLVCEYEFWVSKSRITLRKYSSIGNWGWKTIKDRFEYVSWNKYISLTLSPTKKISTASRRRCELLRVKFNFANTYLAAALRPLTCSKTLICNFSQVLIFEIIAKYKETFPITNHSPWIHNSIQTKLRVKSSGVYQSF